MSLGVAGNEENEKTKIIKIWSNWDGDINLLKFYDIMEKNSPKYSK